MITFSDPEKRRRWKSTLIIVILVTIPCYLLGLLIVWVGNTVKSRSTLTPTVFLVATDTPVYQSPTLPIPTALFESPTPTLTSTIGPSATPSATYFIPSSTPSATPTFTSTPTTTFTPTDTLMPTEIPTVDVTPQP